MQVLKIAPPPPPPPWGTQSRIQSAHPVRTCVSLGAQPVVLGEREKGRLLLYTSYSRGPRHGE